MTDNPRDEEEEVEPHACRAWISKLKVWQTMYADLLISVHCLLLGYHMGVSLLEEEAMQYGYADVVLA